MLHSIHIYICEKLFMIVVAGTKHIAKSRLPAMPQNLYHLNSLSTGDLCSQECQGRLGFILSLLKDVDSDKIQRRIQQLPQ